MQKETGINEQTNNYILSPYNLFSRALRKSTPSQNENHYQ